MSTAAMTRETNQLYKFICRYVSRHGVAPTQNEMAVGCNIRALSKVESRLTVLEREGLIKRQPGVARSLRPIIGACTWCGAKLTAEGLCLRCVGLCPVCGELVRKRGDDRIKTARGWRHSRCRRR